MTSRTTSAPESQDGATSAAAVTDVTLGVFRLNGMLLQWGDALVGPLGLTSARWQMLGAIALAGTPQTAPQIAQAMGVTRQGAQKQLNLLLEQGLVEAGANPAHRRSPLYALTRRGSKLYAQADALWAARASEMGACSPLSHLRTTARTLQALMQQLQLPSEPESSS